jgi:glycerol-3-phosphate acyltransferase PlsY
MAITRMVSLGSISAAVLFAVLTLIIRENYITGEYHWSYIIFGVLLACFVIFNHRTNLKRIINGTENRLSFQKKETKDNDQTVNNETTDVENNTTEVIEKEDKGE